LFNFDKFPRTKRSQLNRFVDQLHAANFKVIITIWPEPTSQYIESLRVLKEWVSAGGRRRKIYGIELEAEDNWHKDYMGMGFGNLNAAADALFQALRGMLPGMPIGVTTTARDFDVRQFRDDQLLNNADFISLQTYENVCTKNYPYPTCNLAKLQGDLRPGMFQRKALEIIRSSGVLKQEYPKAGNKQIIVGLPNYDMGADPKIMGELNMYEAAKLQSATQKMIQTCQQF
jgi:hypothetical protein